MAKLNILIIHTKLEKKDRKTIRDSLYCFKRYVTNSRFIYLDVQTTEDLPLSLAQIPFDGVIFHYTFLSRRDNPTTWLPFYNKIREILAALKGYKVIIPQDEYNYTGSLQELVHDCKVDHIFTCAQREDYDTLYPPEKVGKIKIDTVLTGYVDPASLQVIDRLSRKILKRNIDIGYRARRLPFWLGRHGQLKTELAERFQNIPSDYADIKIDIKMTSSICQNVFLENSWLEFLLRCRTMLGCLGGSGLMDADGEIVRRVNEYCALHPKAGFDEVERVCFPGRDGRLHLYALSPRHFECAMTKTCQILVEGDYYGIFKASLHYIEIKKDFSNIPEVLEKVRDHEYCARLAQKCFDDIVAPPPEVNSYTYAWFAEYVVNYIAQAATAYSRKRRRGAEMAHDHGFAAAYRARMAANRATRFTFNLMLKIFNYIKFFPARVNYRLDELFYAFFNMAGRHQWLCKLCHKKSIRWALKKIFKEKIA
jgi:hypothetical protein